MTCGIEPDYNYSKILFLSVTFYNKNRLNSYRYLLNSITLHRR